MVSTKNWPPSSRGAARAPPQAAPLRVMGEAAVWSEDPCQLWCEPGLPRGGSDGGPFMISIRPTTFLSGPPRREPDPMASLSSARYSGGNYIWAPPDTGRHLGGATGGHARGPGAVSVTESTARRSDPLFLCSPRGERPYTAPWLGRDLMRDPTLLRPHQRPQI